MAFMNRIVTGIGLCIALALVMWLAIAFGATRSDYLALARSGLLLIGLGTLIWGAIWWRVYLVMTGLFLLLVGLVTFWVDGPWHCWPAWSYGGFYGSGYDFWDQLQQGLWHPLNHRASLRLWHAVVAAFMVLNGILISQRASGHRVLGGNLVLGAMALMLAMLFACG